MKRELKVAVDVDGVIHSYVSKFQGVDVFCDPPVEGAIAWLADMHMEGIKVVFHSCRFTVTDDNPSPFPAVDAFKKYLIANGLPQDIVHACEYWYGEGKPKAKLYIDYHGFRFEGRFPDVDVIRYLRDPWNRDKWVTDDGREKAGL